MKMVEKNTRLEYHCLGKISTETRNRGDATHEEKPPDTLRQQWYSSYISRQQKAGLQTPSWKPRRQHRPPGERWISRKWMRVRQVMRMLINGLMNRITILFFRVSLSLTSGSTLWLHSLVTVTLDEGGKGAALIFRLWLNVDMLLTWWCILIRCA